VAHRGDLPPRESARRPTRPLAASRRIQAQRRPPAGTAAVIIFLALGISLLAIVVAQAVGLFGTSATSPIVGPPIATLAVPTSRPRPVLDVQSPEVLQVAAPPGSKPFTAEPALGALVPKYFGELSGTFAVAIQDLDSGQGTLVNADRELPAASLFKLPVMYEVFRQRADGRLSFAVPLVLTAQFAQYDLGTLDLPVGGTVSVAGALERMITRSDNSTANLLLNRVGVQNVNATMHELGLDATRITGERLTTSARDMLAFLEMLALDEDPYTPASAEMVLLLLGQRVNDRLPARLPPDTPVAHKTGNLEDIVHDVGIVYSPAATFVIALLAADVTDLGQVSRAEAALTRAVYDYFNPADAAPPRSALRAPTGAARPTPRPTPPPITLPAADSLAAGDPEPPGDAAPPGLDPAHAAPAPRGTATPAAASGRVVRCFYSAC